MKIKQFTSIKKFKSFTDFDWTKFCRFIGKDATGVPQMQVEELGHVSAIFGENGSGKLTLCGILKSLSQHEDFETALPEIAEVEVKKNGSITVHKFESGCWVNGQLDNASVKLNLLRVLIRLSHDTKTLDGKKYTTIQQQIDEIGRMLGGWIKSVKTESPQHLQASA